MTSVNLHVVLRMSMIIWAVAGAWLVEGERPSVVTILCCVTLAGASVMAAWKPNGSFESYWVAVLLTAFSAIVQGILLVATRHSGRILGLKSSLTLSGFKTAVAGCILLPLGAGLDRHGWMNLTKMDMAAIGLLVGGIGVTALFQGSSVAMQSVILATSTAVLSLAAVIPQIVIGVLIGSEPLTSIQLAGYVLAPLSLAVYTIERIYKWRAKAKS